MQAEEEAAEALSPSPGNTAEKLDGNRHQTSESDEVGEVMAFDHGVEPLLRDSSTPSEAEGTDDDIWRLEDDHIDPRLRQSSQKEREASTCQSSLPEDVQIAAPEPSPITTSSVVISRQDKNAKEIPERKKRSGRLKLSQSTGGKINKSLFAPGSQGLRKRVGRLRRNSHIR